MDYKLFTINDTGESRLLCVTDTRRHDSAPYTIRDSSIVCKANINSVLQTIGRVVTLGFTYMRHVINDTEVTTLRTKLCGESVEKSEYLRDF